MSVDPRPAAATNYGFITTRSLLYPESDGKPMADNTRQWNLTVTLVHGLRIQFRDRADVWVAGDVLWYPLARDPHLCMAPDCLVVFGRPDGDRHSYRQWEEGGIAPQVVFEVLSPSNSAAEIQTKFERYERFGVEEYYEIDPESGELAGWLRRAERFEPVSGMQNWVSPLLGMRFVSDPSDSTAPVKFFYPNGERFLTGPALADVAERYKARAAEEATARRAAEERAEAEAAARRDAEALNARLMAELRRLGVDPATLGGPRDPDSPPAP